MNRIGNKKLAIILSALAGFQPMITPAQAQNNQAKPAISSPAQVPAKEAAAQPTGKTKAPAPVANNAARSTMTPQQQKVVVNSVKNLREAVKLTQTRKWPQAYAAYTKLIKSNPELGMAYADRAVSLIAMKRFKEAVDDCNKAITLGKDTADVYNRRAVSYLQMKKYDTALSDFTKVINLQPTSAAAYRDRAVCYMRKGDKKSAQRDIAMIKKALAGKVADTNQQQKSSFLTVDGSNIVDLGSIKVEKFDEIIKKDPEHKPVYMLHRATVFMFQGKTQKALEDVEQVLKLNDEQLKKGGCPTRDKVQQLRMTALNKLGRHADAIVECNSLLKRNPNDEQARIVLAMSEFQLGKYKEAIANADKIKSNPKLAAAAKIIKVKAAQQMAPPKKGKSSK